MKLQRNRVLDKVLDALRGGEMTITEQPTESIAELAKAIYEAQIRAQVEAEHFGEFLALDVDSGDWEVDKNLLNASNRLRARRPQTRTFFYELGIRQL